MQSSLMEQSSESYERSCDRRVDKIKSVVAYTFVSMVDRGGRWYHKNAQKGRFSNCHSARGLRLATTPSESPALLRPCLVSSTP